MDHRRETTRIRGETAHSSNDREAQIMTTMFNHRKARTMATVSNHYKA